MPRPVQESVSESSLSRRLMRRDKRMHAYRVTGRKMEAAMETVSRSEARGLSSSAKMKDDT